MDYGLQTNMFAKVYPTGHFRGPFGSLDKTGIISKRAK